MLAVLVDSLFTAMLGSMLAGNVINSMALLSNLTAEILLNIVVVNPDISGTQMVTVSEIAAQIEWMSFKNSTEYQTCMNFYRIQEQLDIVIFPNAAKYPPIEVIKTERQTHGTLQDVKLLFDQVRLSTNKHRMEYTRFIIKKLAWKSVIILTDDFNVKEANVLTERLAMYGVSYDAFLLNETSQNPHFLKYLLSRYGISQVKPYLRFIILCSFQNTIQVLQQAEIFDNTAGKRSLLRHFGHWLVVIGPDHLRAIEKMNSNLDHLAVIVRQDMQVNSSVLRGAVNDFAIKTLATIKQHGKSSHEVLNRFKKDSQFVRIRIYTLMLTNHGRGFSEVDSIETCHPNEIFPNVRFGLNKRKLVAAMLEWNPFTVRHENNGSFYYTHASVDMLDYLAEVLNFTYEFKEPADSEWGRIDPLNPGQFTGLIGLMQREEADILPLPVGVTVQREQVSDFLAPIYQAYTTILLRKNQQTASVSSALTDPFKWEVYAYGGATLVIVTIMYVVMERLNPFYRINDKKNNELAGPSESILLFFGAALFQGGVNLPKSLAGRVLVSFWWLYVMIMTAAYCGNLIASLAVQEDQMPYQTLQEILDSKNLKIGLWAGTVLQSSLEQLRAAIKKNRRGMLTAGVMLLHDNAPVHKSRIEKAAFQQFAFNNLINPPSDYYLFRNLESHLRDTSFGDDDKLSSAPEVWLRGQSEDLYRKGIKSIKVKWAKCFEIQNANDTDLKALWSKILQGYREDPTVLSTSVDEHLAKVMSENYGYVSDVTELDSYDITSCNTFRLKEVFLPFAYSFCFVEGSPLIDLFAPEVLKILETGLLQFWLRKWSPTENDHGCEEDDERGAKPIELEKLTAVAIMILTGITCAGLCLLIEVALKMSHKFWK